MRDTSDEFVVISWPESQQYMGLDGFKENSYLINDDKGLDEFGSSSYFVKRSWINQNSDLNSFIARNECEFRLLEIEELNRALELWGESTDGHAKSIKFGSKVTRPKIMLYDIDADNVPVVAEITEISFQKFESMHKISRRATLLEIQGLIAWKNKKKRKVIPEIIPTIIIPTGQITQLVKSLQFLLFNKNNFTSSGNGKNSNP